MNEAVEVSKAWERLKSHHADALRYGCYFYSKEKNMKKLFWVAVLYHGGKNRGKTEVVIDAHEVLARDEDKAREVTIKNIPAKYKEEYDRLEVVVRPF